MLILLLLCSSTLISAHVFTVRDSQTGQSLAAVVRLTIIDEELLTKKQWHSIKTGHSYNDTTKTISSKTIQSHKNKFTVTNNTNLQLLEISAKNYQTINTYIDANSQVQLSTVLLDKIPTKNTNIDCLNINICGYIYDKDSIAPLANVKMVLSNNQVQYITRSNSKGLFKFTNKIPKDATLVSSIKGYRAQIWNEISLQESFSLVIDLEKGSGVIEHSMKHPLMDVSNQSANSSWHQAKISQTGTQFTVAIKERPGGGYYLQPPANIRVGFDATGGTCCGSNCATSQVYSLESYVQKGLDNEWISSWNPESLKAGSIPYRSYGAWHVLNGSYPGYDICAGPCCQAFSNTSYTSTVNAAKATTGIMLEKSGLLARSEYSAQNNSWNDSSDSLSCTNNDLSCGDGSVGSPATSWPCLADPTSTGRGCFGHGRGMSQWGAQYHAQNGEGFADIVDFYYNANNNPSLNRSQYNSSPIRLDNATANVTNISANQSFSIDYQLFNANSATELFGPIILGASLISGSTVFSDPINDDVFTLTQNGNNNLSRQFNLPAIVQTGVYDLLVAVYLDVNADNIITSADWALVSFRAINAITIVTFTDLIFKDSF